ncbi:MAG: hypothetical protein K2X27_18990, partial [Candidatus Obscuribacterales bacterium]|nr:hypothetical protein [Candidatus Obscuribacterales bacterium]
MFGIKGVPGFTGLILLCAFFTIAESNLSKVNASTPYRDVPNQEAPDFRPDENDQNNEQKQSPPNSRFLKKRRVSDLSPTKPKPLAPSSKREAPGPYHGDDPNGPDPHDEIHDAD